MKSKSSSKRIAQSLGFFSLALGVVEIAFTRKLAKTAGFNQRDSRVLRAFGVREMASGVGLLLGKNQRGWLWSRVAGDVLDVAFMG